MKKNRMFDQWAITTYNLVMWQTVSLHAHLMKGFSSLSKSTVSLVAVPVQGSPEIFQLFVAWIPHRSNIVFKAKTAYIYVKNINNIDIPSVEIYIPTMVLINYIPSVGSVVVFWAWIPHGKNVIMKNNPMIHGEEIFISGFLDFDVLLEPWKEEQCRFWL